MDWLTPAIRYGGSVLAVVMLTLVLRRWSIRRQTELTSVLPVSDDRTPSDDSDFLRKEWLDCGKFVLQDDDNPRDHDAIDRWILNMLGNRFLSVEEDGVRILVYHSLNLDIPFSATRNVRERLLSEVRARLRTGWRYTRDLGGADNAGFAGRKRSHRETCCCGIRRDCGWTEEHH